MGKLYKIITYGCQMNLHESEKLAGVLRERGFSECERDEDADVIVFNTCCVRENAEQHAYGNIGAIKKLKRLKRDLIVAVCGCMTQQEGAAEKLKDTFPFVDLVFGTFNTDEFGEMLDRRLAGEKVGIRIEKSADGSRRAVKPFRTSYPNAWVNITYGCNNFCTYCIVPYVRGRERSRSLDEIFCEVNVLVKSGYKEITLLGQNVNSYGNDLKDGVNFSRLLEKLNEIEGDYRLKFMSSHPKDLTEELVKTIASCKRVCHSVHLPVQAGSDRILALMNRRYTKSDYLKKVDLIRKYMPDAAISTDIMVGFPTETEDDFQETLDLCERAEFSAAFTFVYSPRSGTKAAEMDGQIDEETKKDRIMRLIDFQNAKTRKISEGYVGRTITILCEDYDKKRNLYLGRDEYGRMGYFSSDDNPIGEFVKLKIASANGISLFGDLVK